MQKPMYIIVYIGFNLYLHGVIVMDNKNLVDKFQELKSKQAELTAERLKYEAKRDQLSLEIKAIQDKYTEYDLSSVESVEKIISELTSQLNEEMSIIEEQYSKLKAV